MTLNNKVAYGNNVCSLACKMPKQISSCIFVVLIGLPIFFALISSTIHAQSTPPVPTAANSVSGLLVYVGYAEDKESNVPNAAMFPTPWLGSPNTLFLGNPVSGTTNCGNLPSCFDAGAIRLDNPGAVPITITSVTVDIHSSLVGGKIFNNLWGSFTVPAGQSVILTQNPPAHNPSYINFDTSGYPKNNDCLNPITVIPTVTFLINGVSTTLQDSTHVLDTGGIDPGGCKPKQNESIQWRLIGSPGAKTATLSLGPTLTTKIPGQLVTETAIVLDGSGYAAPNVPVNFKVTAGPNTGLTGSAFTNVGGQAVFSYTSSQLGTDTVQASITTVGTFNSSGATVIWSSSATPTPTPSPSPLPPVRVSNLVVNDLTNVKYWSIQSNLQVGATQYGDRSYLITNVPSTLLGATWLKSGMGTRAITLNPTISFTISQTAHVYIALDTRAPKPLWMDSSWVPTGTTLTDDQATGHNTFVLFGKSFPAGVVNLGPNGTGSNTVNMYTVIIQ